MTATVVVGPTIFSYLGPEGTTCTNAWHVLGTATLFRRSDTHTHTHGAVVGLPRARVCASVRRSAVVERLFFRFVFVFRFKCLNV